MSLNFPFHSLFFKFLISCFNLIDSSWLLYFATHTVFSILSLFRLYDRNSRDYSKKERKQNKSKELIYFRRGGFSMVTGKGSVVLFPFSRKRL